MIRFKLNGNLVESYEGQPILQVAEKYGIEIPTLCHHRALEQAGMCRLCLVELFDGRRRRFVTACNYPIWDGMEVNTDSDAVEHIRRLIVELLLARCPEIPIIKRLAKRYEIEETRFKKGEDDCILCGLCVRTCDKMGAGAISLTGRGLDMKVDTPFHKQSTACLGCGACATICPTGIIKVRDEGNMRTLSIRDVTIGVHKLIRCEVCGQYFATEKFLAQLEERILERHPDVKEHHLYCPTCARLFSDRMKSLTRPRRM